MKSNKSILNTTIDTELLKEIKILAIELEMNLNELIELILIDYLSNRNG